MQDDEGNGPPARRRAAQEWLLKAAFLTGERSLQSWRSWRSGNDLEAALDPGSYRLLPFAQRNLQKQGLEDPIFAKLRGLSHHSWTRNMLLLGELQGTINALQQAGSEAMALGGLGLVLQGYQDLSLYPPNSCSLLVQKEQALQAFDSLRGCGWQVPDGLQPEKRFLAARSNQLFYHDKGWRLRLYWRLPIPRHSRTWLQELWSGRRSPGADELPVYLPAPVAQITLASLVEPYPPRPSSFLQAIDLLLALELAGNELDWQSLAGYIQAQSLTAWFQNRVDFLQRVLQVHDRYPGLAEIRAVRAPALERLKFTNSLHQRGALENFPYAWIVYWQQNYRLKRVAKLKGFARLVWGKRRTSYLWQAPWFLLSTLLLRWRQP